MTDEIRLTLPRERPFYGIAYLVLGGLAVRLDLTFETLEDLQLALENVLSGAEGQSALTVVIGVDGNSLRASVGPFDEHDVPPVDGAEASHPTSESVTLQRVLEATVDSVHVAERGDGRWVELTKSVQRAA